VHPGQTFGSLTTVPPPLLPVDSLHVHCVDGHEQSTVYFVSPQLHAAVVSQSPFELPLVPPWIGVHTSVGGPESIAGDASFLALASTMRTPPSFPVPVPASPPSIFPPHAATPAHSKSKKRFFMGVK
jgi:hypothetical protein